MNNLSLVISAPSGAGKTTLITKLLKADDRLEFSVSTTTRPKREGETEGLSYNFIGMEEFQDMIKAEAFIEWAQVYGHYYGTTKKEIDRISWFEYSLTSVATNQQEARQAVLVFEN